MGQDVNARLPWGYVLTVGGGSSRWFLESETQDALQKVLLA